MHLILSCAASHRWPETLPRQLPHLQQLLTRMRCVQTLCDAPAERPHPLLPHERALAQALGWPDAGPWPFAARDSASPGAQAWITPCHWQVGMDQVVMLPPQALALEDSASQQLLQAMQPYMAEDGLTVTWHGALRWLAHGPMLANLACASLARVSGMNVRPWVTDGSLPGPLRRLQSEMQMLLYHHPVNDARAAQGLPIVNSFWLHGAGQALPSRTDTPLRCIDDLADCAQRQDRQAWLERWQAIDQDVLAPLASTGTALTLTLCSETSAHTWQHSPLPWHERLQRRLRPLNTHTVLQALLPADPP